MTSFTDPLTHSTTAMLDSYGRITQITRPEGDSLQYNFDSRGNVTQQTYVEKPSIGSLTIVTTSGYDTTCTIAVKCNQPNWTKDALANETDYTYDSTHGVVTSITQPAAPSGIRPQVRFTYTPLQAYYLNSSGSIVASGSNINEITGTSACMTEAGATLSGTAGVGPFTLSGTAACAGTADESKATINYGPQTAGTANNLWPVAQTVAAGDGSISAATSQTYDNLGNVLTSVGPLGSGQTTVNYYDANRHLLGTVTPDPDGAGPRTPAAVKYTYNADGAVTLAQAGTVPDQTANSFNNNFTSAYQSSTTLDAYDRPIRVSTVSGSTTYAVTDQLYDTLGRLSCAIQYMNMAAVPATIATTNCAASQTTGPFGADRIAQNMYYTDGRLHTNSDSVGTLQTNAYSADGNLTSVLDGNNNLTSYSYDGFNRPSQVNYPSPTLGAKTSNPNDYETYQYDSDNNLQVRRLRDNTTLTFTHDNLGRVATRTPSGTATSSNDYPVSYSYNLANAVTQIARSTDGETVSYSYDALGRMTTESQPYGSVSYQYDAASDPTRITWADGFYAGYVYDMIGGVTSIAANGATSGLGVLASYTYDNLGRRIGVAYGNGTSRAYAYDAVSRLAGLQLAFPSTANNDLIGGVAGSGTPIGYSPASQVATITRSNDAYAWTGASNVSRPYVPNGLNQYSSAGGVAQGYDARGNLTSSGTTSTYTYDKLNDLATVPTASTSIYYDPLGRISEYDTSASTQFYYAGGTPVAEVAKPSGTVMQRYVPGAGTDEVVAWYSGSGTTAPQFLQTDERGSVIAVTNSTGGLVGANSYDEFGIPASTNVGRFGYTGQTWYPEVGLYNYKARWYSPSLGRFMQTDPIGYGGGMNMYNYAQGDPVNGSDPSGLVVVYSCNGDCSFASTSGGGGVTYVDPDTTYLQTGDQVTNGNQTATQLADGTFAVSDTIPASLSEDSYGVTIQANHSCSWYGMCLSGGSVGQFYSSQASIGGGAGFGGGGGGGDGGGGGAGGGPQNQQPRSPCDVAASEKGKIVTAQLSATAILALGLTGSVGYFHNQQSGTRGYFVTVGGGAGADAGVAVTGSNYKNAGSLAGFNDNLNVSPFFPFGVAWSRHNDLNGNRVGNSFGLSYGPKAGISGTMTSTSLFGCTLGGK